MSLKPLLLDFKKKREKKQSLLLHISKLQLNRDYFILLQSTCVLSALNLTEENAIISVRLQNYSNATPLEAFDALKVINLR